MEKKKRNKRLSMKLLLKLAATYQNCYATWDETKHGVLYGFLDFVENSQNSVQKVGEE